MDQKLMKSKLSEGYIHARVILEVVGQPKEYVEESLKGYMKKIKADKEYILVTEKFDKAEKQENGLFSAFDELEVLMKKPIDLLSFCFDYMPSSVEIIAPENMHLKGNDFSGFINDMLVKMHTLNTSVIQLGDTNTFLVKNLAVLLRNFVVVILSDKSMNVKEMQKLMGVKEEDIQKVLNVLENDGKIKKKGELYSAVIKNG